MKTTHIHMAKMWLDQGESDARTARALLQMPDPMQERDVGCHVAALCAQTVEKSIKGYLHLNRQTPAMDHRANKYIAPLLDGGPQLQHREHKKILSELFDARTKGAVNALIDLTPGTLEEKNVPNTEYPWVGEEGPMSPAGSPVFSDRRTLEDWVKIARHVNSALSKLCIAVERVNLSRG